MSRFETFLGDKTNLKLMLGGKRCSMKFGCPLPYNSEVEYIRAMSGAYILTDVKASSELVITILTPAKTPVKSANLVSGGDGWNNNLLQLDSNWKYIGQFCWGNSNKDSIGLDFSVEQTIVIDRNKVYSNGKLLCTITYSEWSSDYELAVFATNRGGTVSEIATNAYISGLKFEQNGVTLRDMIPVRVGSAGYLYDKVSKKLFGSQTSIPLRVGPDKT